MMFIDQGRNQSHGTKHINCPTSEKYQFNSCNIIFHYGCTLITPLQCFNNTYRWLQPLCRFSQPSNTPIIQNSR